MPMSEDAKDFKIIATWPHVAKGVAIADGYELNWEKVAEDMAAWAQLAFERVAANKP